MVNEHRDFAAQGPAVVMMERTTLLDLLDTIERLKSSARAALIAASCAVLVAFSAGFFLGRAL